jgi:small conductance mechanosensitive channel
LDRTIYPIPRAMKETIDQYLQQMLDWAPRFTGALLVLVLGWWLIGKLKRIISSGFDQRELDLSLKTFLNSIIGVGLKVVLFITVAGMLGIPTSSILAVFGAAGLAVGLALQGSLSNFAGGVLILLFKPYKVGDTITFSGETGKVVAIQIFNTIFDTSDGRTVILPNGAVSNGTIINHSSNGIIRVEFKVHLPHKVSFDGVEQAFNEWVSTEKKILKTPQPSVSVLEVKEDHSVFAFRAFVSFDEQGAIQKSMQRWAKNLMEKQA